MNSQEITDSVYQYVIDHGDFNAPYGVLQGVHTNAKNTKYKSVTFGRSRTLDVTVKIYSRNFMTVHTSKHGNQVFRDVNSLLDFIKTL